MPHSALQAGQHTKWRTGEWKSRGGARTLSVNFQVRRAWDLERLEPNNLFPIPASVVFAERKGEDGEATPLAGMVQQWVGAVGSADVRRVNMEITDTSNGIESPYANLARQGAVMVPRVLFFVNEVPNPATVRVGGTITTDPRRGTYDKEPWKSLDLGVLNTRTVEDSHVFDAHLGETVVPYATLEPRSVVLPISEGRGALEFDESESYGIRMGSLERQMRTRWRDINAIWDDNKRPANKLRLIDQLDYYGKLSSQLAWQNNNVKCPVRIGYSASGIPTAAVLPDTGDIVDYTLFWLTFKTMDEAHYITAILNSDVLYERLKPLMPKGQFGARHVQKHLWRLPIPEFDAGKSLHVSIADAGRQAADGVECELANIRQRYPRLTVTIARREVRKWLRESAEGRRVEEVVGELLGDE